MSNFGILISAMERLTINFLSLLITFIECLFSTYNIIQTNKARNLSIFHLRDLEKSYSVITTAFDSLVANLVKRRETLNTDFFAISSY